MKQENVRFPKHFLSMMKKNNKGNGIMKLLDKLSFPEDLKKLNDKGIELEVRMVPDDSKQDVMTLI